MCNLSKGVWEKGYAEGFAIGLEESGILYCIKSVMETMSLTVEQAMAALKVPDDKKQKYIDLLEKQ